MSDISQFIGGSISTYTQLGPLTSSQAVTVPSGTKRIEALLCGGGGSGGTGGGGGGFGGLAIYAIPVTGATSLNVYIGAGGVSDLTNGGQRGGTTYIEYSNSVVAAVGGGGGGGNHQGYAWGPGIGQDGLYSGAGGGSFSGYPGGMGGLPFNNSTLLWSVLDRDVSVSGILNVQWDSGNGTISFSRMYGMGGVDRPNIRHGTRGLPGQGGGGACEGGVPGPGGGAATGVSGFSGQFGGGGGGPQATGSTSPGGNLDMVSVWGLTGFLGGAGVLSGGGGGGGGMLGAGGPANASAATNGIRGGTGGSGGGGGGGTIYSGTTKYLGGSGGNGFAILRFYK